MRRQERALFYTLDVVPNSASFGTVTGGGTYKKRHSVTINATANPGYSFSSWTIPSGSTTTNPYTFGASVSGTYTANFTANKYAITTNVGTGSGTAYIGSSGTTTSSTATYNANVTLRATASTGYHFTDWRVGSKSGTQISTTASPTFTYTTVGASNYYANFTINSYTIAVAVASGQSGFGTVSGGGTVTDSVGGSSTVTITATANSGYRFVQWNDGNTNSSRSVSATGLSNGATVTYTATFIKTYVITLSATNGTISGATSGTRYDSGKSLTLTATANQGYSFSSWTIPSGSTTTNPYTFTVSADATYTANFTANNYTITTNVGNGSGTAIIGTSGSTTTSSVAYKSSVTLTATASTGYHFTDWRLSSKTGTQLSTNASYTFTYSTVGASNYYANFTINSYTIAVAVASGQSSFGTVSGGGTVTDSVGGSSTVTISASANSGYRFVQWNDGNTNSSRTISATGLSNGATVTYTATFIKTYVITLSASHGTITGATSGTRYDNGKSLTLTATANQGYTFSNWTLPNSTTTTTNPYSFNVSADATYTANFTANSYAITTNVGNGSGTAYIGASGTTTSSTATYDASVTLRATPSTGYHFVDWRLSSKTGTQLSTNASYTFTYQTVGASNYYANFAINTYTVKVAITSGQSSYGSVYVNTSGTTQITATDNVAYTIVATANSGYRFVQWSDGSTSASRTITLHGEAQGKTVTYTATFIKTYVITATAGTGGSATGSGTYDSGASVSLNATANQGYSFSSWTTPSGSSTTNPYTFSASADASYTANFTANSYAITTNVGNGSGTAYIGTSGAITSSTATYNASVTLRATASTGYHFTDWRVGSKSGTQISTTASPTFTYTTVGASNYYANFTINSYTIKVAVSSGQSSFGTVSGGGTVTDSVGGTSTVTISATANTGYRFVKWDDNNTSATRTISATGLSNGATVTYTAIFIKTYVISVSAGTGGTVSSTSATVDSGGSATFTASANTGYSFTNWTNSSGTSVGASTTLSLTNITADASYTANFSINSYTITVSPNNTSYGTVSGGGTYNYGATPTLGASPKTGYHFSSWSDGGTQSHKVTVTGNASYTATFAINSYTIAVAVASGQSGFGTVSGGGTVTDSVGGSSTVTITATASSGYRFKQWNDGDTNYSRSVGATGLSNGATVTYTAEFLKTYTVSTAVNTSAGGTAYVKASGTDTSTTVDTGESITVRATANSGYRFGYWSNDGGTTSVDTNATTTFTNITANTTYTAVFIKTYTVTLSTTTIGSTTAGGTAYIGTTGTSTSVTVDTGGSVTLRVNSTNTGYRFDFWSKDGGSNPIDSSSYSTTKTISNITSNSTFQAVFIKTYTITAVSKDTSQGNAYVGTSGTSTSATIDSGATATFRAVPATGVKYWFANWNDDTTDNPKTVNNVTSNLTYTASFIHYWTISVAVASGQSSYGSVSGGGNVADAGSISILATANSGYRFLYWNDGNTNASRTLTSVCDDATYTATFAKEYSVTVSTSTLGGGTGGTATGGGTYYNGQTVQLNLTATVSDTTNYVFYYWDNGGSNVSTANPYKPTVTISGNVTYTAVFRKLYNVYAAAGTGGSVSETHQAIPYGETCYITASPSSGYSFVNWTLNGTEVSTSTTLTLSNITAERSTSTIPYTANFVAMYTVTIANGNPSWGSVTPTGYDNTSVAAGTVISCYASPLSLYDFYRWEISVNSGAISYSYDNPYSLTVSGNKTNVVGYFKLKAGTITITGASNNTSYGHVYVGASGTSTSGNYASGTSVTIRAVPTSSSYVFVGWTDDSTIFTDSRTVAPTSSTTYTATFMTAGASKISVYHDSTNTGTGTLYATTSSGTTTASSYVAAYENRGTTYSVGVTPDTGYSFYRIRTSVDGGADTYSTSNPTTYMQTSQGGSSTHYIQCTKNSYKLNAKACPSAGGTISGTGTVTYGNTASLTATPASGYSFVCWSTTTETSGSVSTSNPYSFEMPASNVDLYAIFSVKSKNPTITVSYGGTYNGDEDAMIACDTLGGEFPIYTILDEFKGSFEVESGETLVLTGHNGKYSFQYWIVNGEEQEAGADVPLEIVVTEDTTIVAYYGK